MELNAVLGKVRALIEKAEHPNTDPVEAQTYRRKADELMLKYAVDEAMAEAARPAEMKSKPDVLVIQVPHGSENATFYLRSVAHDLAAHCRVLVQHYQGYDSESRASLSKVYGFQSDLRYFEMLWTTLQLHMLDVLRPTYKQNQTLEENAYRLHSAGYNWLEIARMAGWKRTSLYRVRELFGDDMAEEAATWKTEPWLSPDESVVEPSMRMGSRIKRAYRRACAMRGEKYEVISAGGAASYREDAAQGYVTEIRIMLREIAKGREGGTELVLRSRMEDLEQFYRESNPKAHTQCPSCSRWSADPYKCDQCGGFLSEPPPEAQPCPKCMAAKSGHCRDHPSGGRGYRLRDLNERGYRAGRAHARTADLTGNKVGSNRRAVN